MGGGGDKRPEIDFLYLVVSKEGVDDDDNNNIPLNSY
jgi:hypothetical protein